MFMKWIDQFPCAMRALNAIISVAREAQGTDLRKRKLERPE